MKFLLTPVRLSTNFFSLGVLNNLWFWLSDVGYDPSKEARAARKAHMAKNEQQHLKNLARSQRGQASTATAPGALSERKGVIERTLAMTRASTASMGKFDRTLEGEKKPRGVKHKVKRIPHSCTTSSSHVFDPFFLLF
jgi:regulator of ribosome biosynthesis